jgi:hypothetical protein
MINANDYNVMEVKMNGTWQKADVLKTLSDGTCLILMGSKTSDGGYMSGGCVPADAYRDIVKYKTVVKSSVAIMQELIDGDYSYIGFRWAPNGSSEGKHTFQNDMWKFCGEEPSDWSWNPEWLEEVEVTEED